MTTDAERALAEIDRWGILLLQDAKLPSLAGLIAGEPVRGSWWGHPEGARIFEAAGVLDDEADVATFKLVEGKVCFVHRRLWPALVAIGSAREQWQLARLDAGAGALLERVEREGCVRATGKPAKALAARLLVTSAQVHTESGKHASELSSWARFVEQRGVCEARSVADGKLEIAARVAAMVEASGGRGRLPWT